MIEIIEKKVSRDRLLQFAEAHFKTMIKYVADIELGIIAAGGELQADAEKLLLEHGSSQENLWGANLYPFKDADERHEYTSFINIRPSQENYSMEIEGELIRNSVKQLAESLLLGSDEIIVRI